jgi:hypothetical protein
MRSPISGIHNSDGASIGKTLSAFSVKANETRCSCVFSKLLIYLRLYHFKGTKYTALVDEKDVATVQGPCKAGQYSPEQREIRRNLGYLSLIEPFDAKTTEHLYRACERGQALPKSRKRCPAFTLCRIDMENKASAIRM